MSTPTQSFSPTRWTLVLRAGQHDPDGRTALADLCETYYQPVFRFLRAEGRTEDTARELTQEFFARLLRSGNIRGADPSLGRFRSYLLGAVKHFLQDLRDQALTQKRGSGHTPEPLPDESTQATGPRPAHPIQPPSDTYFDREWALHLLDRALLRLSHEMEASGKAPTFALLKPWLTGTSTLPQSEAATQLNLSPGALKVTIHRLRSRFREIVRQEIASTVATPEEIDTEVRYLVEVLSS